LPVVKVLIGWRSHLHIENKAGSRCRRAPRDQQWLPDASLCRQLDRDWDWGGLLLSFRFGANKARKRFRTQRFLEKL